MPKAARPSTPSADAPRLGDPAYSLLGLAAGTLLQVGTLATAYVSTFTLTSRSDALGGVA
ncbi:hypothetical protein [Microbacterium sp. cx-59]|uniref:hypothetical protein n=1 Tax=Microbacterium sp. cx-59 TaxID=2891207 RepID=UPI001E51CB1F|nr:hypothetical protein [Microbacterium sp. cx-59]MCC4908384.1 hypothetical protein [Microbacterium sp. cx-59]